MQYTSHYTSPLGEILLAADDVGLTGLWFVGQKYFARNLEKDHEEREIPLFGKVKQEGLALIPLSVYFRGSRVKLEIALCKGKKLYDKRDDAAKKDAKRQIDRAMKERNVR